MIKVIPFLKPFTIPFFLCNLQVTFPQSRPPLVSEMVALHNNSLVSSQKLFDSPEAVLQLMFGYASFREDQKEAIQSLLDNKDTVVVIPTGGGKTVIYTIACVMRKGAYAVISPLIMLMYDQVARLRQLGIKHMLLRYPTTRE